MGEGGRRIGGRIRIDARVQAVEGLDGIGPCMLRAIEERKGRGRAVVAILGKGDAKAVALASSTAESGPSCIFVSMAGRWTSLECWNAIDGMRQDGERRASMAGAYGMEWDRIPWALRVDWMEAWAEERASVGGGSATGAEAMRIASASLGAAFAKAFGGEAGRIYRERSGGESRDERRNGPGAGLPAGLERMLRDLGIDAMPTDAGMLRDAWIRRMLRTHPDMGGSVEEAKAANIAFEALAAIVGTGRRR